MALSAGTRLGPYEILSPLGAGGMGEVYRARDARLGRDVAIKVLPEHLSQDPNALARFEREARAVAALSHPNILAIHDFGSDAGIAFAVTELLEGETLRRRLSTSSLPWRKAVELAAAVADGLWLAHSKGIVHRDLKPENIFLTSNGQVKILDFGLARWVSPACAEDRGEAPTETLPGIVVGTVGYMSPEQVCASAAGPPSDIFALGCVLYEMVAGGRAFGGGAASEIMAAILRDDPAPLSESGRPCPPGLEHVVRHCLEKNPGERFQSARDLAFALRAITGADRPAAPGQAVRLQRRLRWIGAGVLLLFIAAAITVNLYWRRGPAIESLAILPFANVGTDPNTEYISDGMTESLINNLSMIRNVTVKSRNAVFRYKGKETDAQQAGQALQVQAVLIGRVAQRDQDLSISAELIQVKDNAQIWGKQYKRKIADIQLVQTEISREISSKINAGLTGEEQQRVTRPHTENSEAYRLYLQALYQRRRMASAESLAKALEYGSNALKLDPEFARAHVLLADIYNSQGAFAYGFGVISPQESATQARAEASAALKIDDTLAEAHALLALVAMQYDWDWTAAGQEFRKALDLDPNSAFTHHWYSHYLTALGRFQESLQHSKRALELEPVDLGWNCHLGWHYMYAREFDLALQQLQTVLEVEPNFGVVHWYIGLVYEQKRMWPEAIAHLKKAVVLRSMQRSVLLLLGHTYAASGDTEEARKVLAQANVMRREKYVSGSGIASIYTALGEKEKAFQWLETAIRERDSWLNLLKVDPRFDPLRGDPRFLQLLQRVGL